MFSAEFQVLMSFSLVAGAVLGALLCSYLRAVRNRPLPSEAVFQTCLELREQLEMLQQSLQADAHHAPHRMRREAPAGIASRLAPALAAPARAVSPVATVPFPGAGYDPPVSSKELPNMAAWRRLDRPQTLAHHLARGPRPAGTEMVAPVRRRARGTDRPPAIDARMAQEIVLRHLGVSMNPMPRPAAAGADQPGKLLHMPTAHAGELACNERLSFA